MGFTQPLGLLALLALPVILYLHLFRRRFQARRVSALFLFAGDALPAAAGRTRTRLLRTISLWAELLAALALALWLGGLHFGAPTAERHVVLVLDDSASMSAEGPLGSTLAKARSWAEAFLAELPSAAEVTLIRSGKRPEVLVGPRAHVRAALSALSTWEPTRPAHDLARSWEIGLDLAGSGGELVFLTDREDRPPPPRYRLVAFGESADNAAIVSGRRLRRGAEERLFVDVRGWSHEPMSVTLEVEPLTPSGRSAGGGADTSRKETRLQKTVQLEPGRTLHVAWTLPASELPLLVRLSDDALAIDNTMLLLPEPQRVVPAHVAFDDEWTAALGLKRVFAALPDVALIRDPEAAHLVLAHKPGLASAGATELLIGAVGLDAADSERDAWVGPFLLERRRVPGDGAGPPLLAGLSLEGVVWSAAPIELPGMPLVLAGEQALLTEESVRGGVRLHMNLDPLHSNLTSSPDWPILLSNLVEHVRTRLPGPLQVNLRIGSELAYRFVGSPEEVAELNLFDPVGGSEPARGWRLLTFDARKAGIHELRRGQEVVARYAVSFVDAEESDLHPRVQVDIPEVTARAAVRAGLVAEPGGIEARILALLLLLALTVDWFVLGRKP